MCMQQLFYDVFKTQDTREIIFKHHENFVEDEKINESADIMVHIHSKFYKYTDDEIRNKIHEEVYYRSEMKLAGYNSPMDLEMIEYCIKNSIPMEVKLKTEYKICLYYLKRLKRKELKKLFKECLIRYLKHEDNMKYEQDNYFTQNEFHYKCQNCHGNDEGCHLEGYHDVTEFQGFRCSMHWCDECHWERTRKFMITLNDKHYKKLDSYKVKKY